MSMFWSKQISHTHCKISHTESFSGGFASQTFNPNMEMCILNFVIMTILLGTV